MIPVLHDANSTNDQLFEDEDMMDFYLRKDKHLLASTRSEHVYHHPFFPSRSYLKRLCPDKPPNDDHRQYSSGHRRRRSLFLDGYKMGDRSSHSRSRDSAAHPLNTTA